MLRTLCKIKSAVKKKGSEHFERTAKFLLCACVMACYTRGFEINLNCDFLSTTLAKINVSRVDLNAPNMALPNWSGFRVSKYDVIVVVTGQMPVEEMRP